MSANIEVRGLRDEEAGLYAAMVADRGEPRSNII